MSYQGIPPEGGPYGPPPNAGFNPNQPPQGFGGPGYPPAQGFGGPGYPPPQGYYPEGPGYPPPQGQGYPPPQPQGYPQPQQGGHQGFAPQQGGYVPPGYQPPMNPGYQPGPPPPQEGGFPIVSQPGPGNVGPQPDGWMNMPQRPPNCPPGLEYLITVDKLLVKQKVEILEVLTMFETENKFTIKNGNGEKIFYASEETNCCSRNLFGPLRPFEMKIMDIFKNNIIHLHRPLACMSCCFPCCLQSMEVSSPPGSVIGSIEQQWSILQPIFIVKDGGGNPIFKIEGPACRFSCGADVEFKILTLDGATEIGVISKQWSGLLREIFTDADYFGVQFPMDLDVKMKAVLLGAVFLMDMMFYEKSGHAESDRPGML